MKTKEVQIKNKRVKIELNDDAALSVFEEIFQDNDYSPIQSILEEALSGTVLDLGAHIGCFAVWAAALNPQLRIICIEPEEENYNYLKKNLKNNRLDSIITKNVAVSNITGNSFLEIAEDSHNHKVNEMKGKKIMTIAFQDLIEKQIIKSKRILLCKVDIEGMEHKLFEFTDNESLKKIQNYIIEYHQYNSKDEPGKIINKLKNLGYKVTRIPSKYDNRLGMIVAKS